MPTQLPAVRPPGASGSHVPLFGSYRGSHPETPPAPADVGIGIGLGATSNRQPTNGRRPVDPAVAASSTDAEKELLRQRIREANLRRDAAVVRTAQTRHEAARVALLRDKMEREQALSAKAADRDAAHREARAKPLSKVALPFIDSLGTGEAPRPIIEGRSSRRTGFVTDYQGRAIIGGAAESDVLQDRMRRVRTIAGAAMKEKDDLNKLIGSYGGVGGGALSEQVKRGGAYENNNGRRMDPGSGHTDLEWMKKCSSKRTRAYRDYNGDRIRMDPCDWPTDDTFVLIGK